MKAIWNETIIAEADRTLVLEGRHYFPQDSVKLDYLSPKEDCDQCPWKGLVNYYDLKISGEQRPNAAWYYPNPKERAVDISGYISFGGGILIEN